MNPEPYPHAATRDGGVVAQQGTGGGDDGGGERAAATSTATPRRPTHAAAAAPARRRRAATVCAEPGCPHTAVRRGRCDSHAPPPWAGSRERRERLGIAVTSTMRQRIRKRARHHCQNCGAFVPRGTGAVDHRIPGGPSTLGNLWLLCAVCDDVKTRADLAAMRAARASS